MSSSAKVTASRKSTTSQQSPARSTTGSASTSACCPQCHNIQSSFYCIACHSERLVWQHTNRRRLQEERQRVKGRVDIRLGLREVPVSSIKEDLSSPFREQVDEKEHRRKASTSTLVLPHCGASQKDRIARATRTRLQDDIQQQSEELQKRRKGIIDGKRKLAQKRQDLDRRRSLLETAQMSLFGLVETEQQERVAFSHEKVESLKELISELRVEGKQVADEIAKVRAHLAREAYLLFDVRAPTASLANNRISSSSSRNQRSKERYTAGAFAIDFTNAFDLGRNFRDVKPKEEIGNINDWTIMGLVLPVPSDVKRFERGEINGAVSHLIQLLQLVTAYLGITLPFVVSMQGDHPYIRANRLWGAGAKESLHLSASTHSALIATTTNSATMGAMGASMMSSLGASTLSTLESFVQLPSGKALSWAKSVAESSVKGPDNEQRESLSSEGSAAEDAATINGRHFCSALTMLSYDVAYLAHLQGVKIDLVMTAGSSLRVLSKAFQSNELGKRSHASYHPSSTVSHLQFASLDFAQLLQVHEPGSNADKGSISKKHSSTRPIMEGSYVDAKKAAESILDVQQKDVVAKATATTTNRPTKKSTIPSGTINVVKPEKMSSLAAKRIPSNLPIQKKTTTTTMASKSQASSSINTGKVTAEHPSNTLDFLRVKGQKDPKSTSANSSSPNTVSNSNTTPPTSGTVTFNGKEIRGKAKSSLSKAVRSKGDDEGWHVL